MTQVENSLNLLESGMELQVSQRSSKKLWVIFIVALLLLSIIALSFGVLFHFLFVKAPESCWAQASLDTETQGSYSSGTKSWNWPQESTFCMKETENQKQMIIRSGTYFIYSQMKRKSKGNAPFAIRLMKGNEVLIQSQSEDDIIVLMGIHRLNEGDEISLTLNDDNFEHIEKNSTQTFWGILRMAP